MNIQKVIILSLFVSGIILSLFVSGVFISGCTTKQSEEKKDSIYYVIDFPRKKIHKSNTDKNINISKKSEKVKLSLMYLPPSVPFYFTHNFIFFDTSKIFYFYGHFNYKFINCGVGIDYSKPNKINLLPDSLIELKINNLQEFLKNLGKVDGIMRAISIASSTDTIRTRAFSLITNYCKEQKCNWYPRSWTEEEQYAVTAKINNTPYNSDSVVWEVGFSRNPHPMVWDSTQVKKQRTRQSN